MARPGRLAIHPARWAGSAVMPSGPPRCALSFPPALRALVSATLWLLLRAADAYLADLLLMILNEFPQCTARPQQHLVEQHNRALEV